MENCVTWREIMGQVEFWKDSAHRAAATANKFQNTLAGKQFSNGRPRVVLSGAGSSHYIGLSLENLWRTRLEIPVETRASTDLTSVPDQLLSESDGVGLVSFSRSGGSPESISAVNLVNQLCHETCHLIITCSSEGRLSQHVKESDVPAFVVALDEATADKGLAMTASFTNMLIAGQALVCNDLPVSLLTHVGSGFLESASEVAKEVSKWDFNRAVFLGDGALFAAAAEAALKVEELTDGAVMTTSQTFLGLRHGPLAVINENTLVVCFIANNEYTFAYERDLLEGLIAKQLGCRIVAIAQEHIGEVSELCDLAIPIDSSLGTLPDLLRPPVDVIFGQLLGVWKSLEYGLDPDEPSRKRNAISRVVDGVKLYEFT